MQTLDQVATRKGSVETKKGNILIYSLENGFAFVTAKGKSHEFNTVKYKNIYFAAMAFYEHFRLFYGKNAAYRALNLFSY